MKLIELSPSETWILSRIAEGWTNKAIAADRGSSINTVKNQIAGLMFKLKAKNRAHAAALGVATGIVNTVERGE